MEWDKIMARLYKIADKQDKAMLATANVFVKNQYAKNKHDAVEMLKAQLPEQLDVVILLDNLTKIMTKYDIE